MSIEQARTFSQALLCFNCCIFPLLMMCCGWWLHGWVNMARAAEGQSVWDFWKRLIPAPPVRRPKEL